MSYSTDTLARMEAFSREHARLHLENAELQYLAEIERARRAAQGGSRPGGAEGLTGQSLKDAQDDLMEYMADCMEGLMGQGCTEQDALEQVMASLAAETPSPETLALRERYGGYFDDEGLTKEVMDHYEQAIVVGCLTMGGLIGAAMAWRGLLHMWFWPVIGGIAFGSLFGAALSRLVKGAMLQRRNRGRR